MTITTKNEFEAFVLANCGLTARTEPRRERDGEYLYECFDNADGDEIAFISYKAGAAPTYTIITND